MTRYEDSRRNSNRRSSEAYRNDSRNFEQDQDRERSRRTTNHHFNDSSMDRDFDLRGSRRSNYPSERDDDRGFSRSGRGWGDDSSHFSDIHRAERSNDWGSRRDESRRSSPNDRYEYDMEESNFSRADYTGYGTENRGGHFGKGPQGWKRSDERIKEDVCEALYRSYDVDASSIDVIVKEGCVTLKGSVESREAKRAAERCVEDLSGVDDVQNELRVNRQSGSINSSRQSDSHLRNVSNQANLS